MNHYQLPQREPGGFCEDAPSKIRFGWLVATLPICHNPEAVCLQRHEISAANSGQQ